MWGLNFLADVFGDISGAFSDIADGIRNVPILGAYLSAPFNYFKGKFWWAEYCTTHISYWADDVDDRLRGISSWYDIYHKIKSYFPIVEKTWSDITNHVRNEISKIDLPYVPTYSEIFVHIEAMCVSAWNILLHSWSDVHGLIMTYLDTLQDWSQDPWDGFVTKLLAALPHIPSIDDVIDYVCDRFESILDRLFEEGD